MVMTPQRQTILEELRNCQNHPTADELFQMVRQRIPKVSLATVYRNLEVMASAGMIRKIDMAGGQMRFDGTVSPHHHMRCVKCSRVMDAPPHVLQKTSNLPSELNGHLVLEYRLDILVECASCRRAPSAQSNE